jgi:EAL domain-containing protein (putative c-di-GMP-specific phosphodiesterase class I)
MELRLAVNVSAQQLQEDRLLKTLKELREVDGSAVGLIDLELTESTLFDHSDQTRGLLEEIKRLGYRLGLDDFGTGYSSLSYIQRLPIDKIKIDRQFVATMDNRPQALAIVTAILSLARALHLEVIAEGVETEMQASRLLEVNCMFQQGFFYSRAVPAREFEKWVSTFEAKAALAID